MRRNAYYYFVFVLTVILMLMVSGNAPAKRASNKAKDFTLLENLEMLVDISQDLDIETTVYLKPAENCFCSCRDGAWSCTDTECKNQNQECENFLKREEPREMNTYRY